MSKKANLKKVSVFVSFYVLAHFDVEWYAL